MRQWEKCGKLPGKTNTTENIIKLNQYDNYNELFSPISRFTRSQEIFFRGAGAASPAVNCPLPGESHPPATGNQNPGTNYSEPETPPKNQREIEREISAKNTAIGII